MSVLTREHAGSRSRKHIRRAVTHNGYAYGGQAQQAQQAEVDDDEVWAQRILERRQAAEQDEQLAAAQQEATEREAALHEQQLQQAQQAQQWQAQVWQQARMHAHAELARERSRIFESGKKAGSSTGVLTFVVLITFGLAVFAGRLFLEAQEQKVATATAMLETQRRNEMAELALRADLKALQQHVKTVETQRDTLSAKLLQLTSDPELAAAATAALAATALPKPEPAKADVTGPAAAAAEKPVAAASATTMPAPPTTTVVAAAAPTTAVSPPAAVEVERAKTPSESPAAAKVDEAPRAAPARAEAKRSSAKSSRAKKVATRSTQPKSSDKRHRAATTSASDDASVPIALTAKPAPSTSSADEGSRHESAPLPKVPATFKRAIADDPLAGTGLETTSSTRSRRLTK